MPKSTGARTARDDRAAVQHRRMILLETGNNVQVA
jgi:hypothetical protein